MKEYHIEKLELTILAMAKQCKKIEEGKIFTARGEHRLERLQTLKERAIEHLKELEKIIK